MSDFLVAANVADLYADADTKSGVVTQAISGSLVQTQEERGGFHHVRTEDRYHGWIAAHRLIPVWDSSDYFQTNIAGLLAEVYSSPDPHSELLTKLVVSTRVAVAHRPEIGDYVPVVLPDKAVGYVHKYNLNMSHDGALVEADLVDQKVRHSIDVASLKLQILQMIGQQVARVAKQMIGTPYLWGGCTPFGIDCSGLVQLCYKLNGVQLLRDADLQFHDRRFQAVLEGQSLEDGLFDAGDLLVFGPDPQKKATHIGIALGDGRFIHSAGGRGVRIDECLEEQYNALYLGAIRLSPHADLTVDAA